MVRILFAVSVFISFAIIYQGCSSQSQVREPEFEGTVITGTITYIDLEGGFFGIVGDDGNKYDPLNLEPEYQKDGLRIKVGISVRKNVMTVRMWGTPVQINQIRMLDHSK